MNLPAGIGELRQCGEVWERVLAQRPGGVGDVLAGVAAGTVLGGVDRDDVVADGFVQDAHERGDGVLDRGCRVLDLPAVDDAVDHPRGDLRDSHVSKCGQHTQSEPGRSSRSKSIPHDH